MKFLKNIMTGNLMQAKLLMLAISLVLFGCASNRDVYGGDGGTLYDYFASRNYGEVVRRANQYCTSRGLGAPSVQKTREGCFFCMTEYDEYSFTCSQAMNTNSKYESTAPPPARVSMDEAKNKCIAMGFKAGTDGLGKCVLQLTK